MRSANYCEAVLEPTGERKNHAAPATRGDSAAAAMAMPDPPSKKPESDAKPTVSDFIQSVFDTTGELLDPRWSTR